MTINRIITSTVEEVFKKLTSVVVVRQEDENEAAPKKPDNESSVAAVPAKEEKQLSEPSLSRQISVQTESSFAALSDQLEKELQIEEKKAVLQDEQTNELKELIKGTIRLFSFLFFGFENSYSGDPARNVESLVKELENLETIPFALLHQAVEIKSAEMVQALLEAPGNLDLDACDPRVSWPFFPLGE